MSKEWWTTYKGEFYQYHWDDEYVPGYTRQGDAWLDSLATAALYVGGI